MSPLATALLGRALGQRLPLHTWLACVVGAVSLAKLLPGFWAERPDNDVDGVVTA
jgi:hypothetical protein